jgi:hypothetical protein
MLPTCTRGEIVTIIRGGGRKQFTAYSFAAMRVVSKQAVAVFVSDDRRSYGRPFGLIVRGQR